MELPTASRNDVVCVLFLKVPFVEFHDKIIGSTLPPRHGTCSSQSRAVKGQPVEYSYISESTLMLSKELLT